MKIGRYWILFKMRILSLPFSHSTWKQILKCWWKASKSVHLKLLTKTHTLPSRTWSLDWEMHLIDFNLHNLVTDLKVSWNSHNPVAALFKWKCGIHMPQLYAIYKGMTTNNEYSGWCLLELVMDLKLIIVSSINHLGPESLHLPYIFMD